jgi:folate-binding protein YgfZ
MLIMEDAELSSADDLCCLTLHGPIAEQALDALLPELLPTALGRIALCGEQDWLLAVERVRVQQWRRAGAPLAGGARLGDAAQWHDWRVEHGLPEFGVDFGSADNPHDAALERRAVSWSKGCYLGQEVVCMQDMRGKPKRRLVSLLLADGEVPPPSTAVVDAAGEKLGEVTSAAFSRARARAVAIARVVAGAADGQGSGLFVAGKPAQLFAAGKPAL